MRFAGVGPSGLVGHLPKDIAILHRFFPLDCSAFRIPEMALDQAGMHIQNLVLAAREHNGI